MYAVEQLLGLFSNIDTLVDDLRSTDIFDVYKNIGHVPTEPMAFAESKHPL